MFLISPAEAPVNLALCFRDPNTTLRAAYKWIMCRTKRGGGDVNVAKQAIVSPVFSCD